MTDQFPAWQIANFKKAFFKFDANGDGTINANALSDAMQELGQSMDTITHNNMLTEFEIEENGVIEFCKFLRMITQIMARANLDNKMEEELQRLDKEDSGYITAAQLRKAMSTEHSVDGEIDEWLRDKHIEDNDKIGYHGFFKRKRSIQERSDRFSSGQLTTYRDEFSQFDINNDGTISMDELQALMKKLGISLSKKGLENMMNEADVNGNGIIDYVEFLTMIACNMNEDTDFEKSMNKGFSEYDVNNEGFVTAAELRIVLARFCDTMTVGEFDEFLHDSNVADNDRINYRKYFSSNFTAGTTKQPATEKRAIPRTDKLIFIKE